MATKKTPTARKRTGWSVASAAGKLLAQIADGSAIWIVGKESRVHVLQRGGPAENITNRVERICASALGQREVAGRRKQK